MSDADIARAVAPFWRCPDWCNRGANYRAELDALRAEVAELEQAVHNLHIVRGALTMERDRLRAALEEAPEPARYARSHPTHALDPYDEDYDYWFKGTRREALDG